MKKRYRKRFIIGLAMLFLSLLQAIYARFTPYFPGDVQVTRFVQSFNNHFLVSLMEAISRGFTGFPAILLVAVCVAVIWWRLGIRAAALMAAAAALSPVDGVLKFLIQRPRPTAILVNILMPASGLSFPSGHSFFATMTLGMMTYFVIKYISNRTLRWVLAAGLILSILLVGFSRVYLGAHWSSDVVEAYFIAGGFVLLLSVVYEQLMRDKTGDAKTGLLKTHAGK